MRSNKTIKLTILLLLFAGFIFIGLLLYNFVTNKGTIDLVLEPKDAKISLNEKEIKDTNSKIKAGEYSIKAEKNGYVAQETKIVVKKGETSKLQIFLQPASIENTISSTIEKSEVYKNAPYIPKFTVGHYEEFYGKSWIVAAVYERGGADLVLVVLKQDTGSDKYELFLPPFSNKEESILQNLPPDVRNSIVNENWFDEAYLGEENH